MESGKGLATDGDGHSARSGDQSVMANVYLNPLDHLMAKEGKRNGALCR